MVAQYGSLCMNRASLYSWEVESTNGRKSVIIEQRGVCPVEVSTLMLKNNIEKMILTDRRVKLLKKCLLKFGVNVDTIQKIIHDDLNFRKTCASRIPKMLSP